MSFVVPKQLVKVDVEQALRIENVIEKMLDRVKNMSSVSLQSLAGGVGTIEERKKVLIVNFIALLELLRSGSIQAEQHTEGGDIMIQPLTSSH
jgi:chromatin segregation and condensation protein Rec8/ScpA/Scc1 (kleisin family)